MTASRPSSDRDRIENAVRQLLRYMASQFGLYAVVSGVEGEDVKRACSGQSELSNESKQLVGEMMSLISEYNDLSDGAFKEEVREWTRTVRPRHG